MRYLAAPRLNARGRLICYGVWDSVRNVWAGPVAGGLYGGILGDIVSIADRLNKDSDK